MSTILGRPLILNVGPKPIIYIDNEFLGSIPLQYPCICMRLQVSFYNAPINRDFK